MFTKKFAVELVKDAGKFLLRNFRKDYSLLKLRERSKRIVTRYDKLCDRLIVKALSKNFPDYNILSEESGFIDKNSEYSWVIDPLDGSSNFANSNPFFSISLALLHQKKPIFGVVYAPFLKELFLAEEGKNTLLNGKPVCVSNIDKLEESYVVWCEGKDTNVRMSKINAKLHPKIKDLRKLGSAGLECAWVSCGRAEVFITTKIAPWDVAAGILLVKEAGGKVTDFRGSEWEVKSNDLIVSNGKLHEKILKIVSELNV